MKSMRTRVSNHGPDALVRIPVAAPRAAGIALGDTVAVRVEDGRLVIEHGRNAEGARDIALALLTARGVTRAG
jgi:antitoxin component of MazEF toxin-antitoxin module